MALSDHLRELRARLIRVVAGPARRVRRRAVLLRPALRAGPRRPTTRPREQLGRDGRRPTPYVSGAGGPLMLQLKLCGLVGDRGHQPVLALPDLGVHPARAARRASASGRRVFAAVAGPLFFAGVALGYYMLPKGLEVLIGFTPADAARTWSSSASTSRFLTRMLLVFGIAFEIPLFVILLNLAGVVSRQGSWARYRPWIIIGTFVFAAVATPVDRPVHDAVPGRPDAGAVRRSPR